ncbi:hypothetical protein CRENPOLYSF1_1290020 [Crenothrix polyspora]|uniref:Uncharacterized protein n=1 Tax=Crenothrix polyspora TaxID=360316 RepID=A0A1R4H178_9GAMM|nr:hypothetical protein CRENPOLYSF1_1290020 [Crenothrix polyspora]
MLPNLQLDHGLMVRDTQKELFGMLLKKRQMVLLKQLILYDISAPTFSAKP